jgi:hypothetical protein
MRTQAFRLTTLIATLAGSLVHISTQAQSYDLPINTSTSTLSTGFSASASFAGNFRGNYNQTTNPTGTRVVNFVLFGSPQAAPTNNTRTFTGTGSASTSSNITGRPGGAYTLVINPLSKAFRLQTLRTTLVAPSTTPPTFPASASITTGNFSTVAPRYDYPLGVIGPLSVPFGNVSVQSIKIDQTTPLSGTLAATPIPEQFSFSGNLACTVTSALDLSGSPLAPTPAAQSLPVTGTVTFLSGGQISASLTINLASTVTDNTPQTGPVDSPFDFPAPTTATPPPPPAQMLVNVTVNSSTVNTTGSTTLPVSGARTNAADIAGLGGVLVPDGQRTSDDVIAFLAAFFALNPIADIASLGGAPGPDGQFTADDVVAFLSAFLGS